MKKKKNLVFYYIRARFSRNKSMEGSQPGIQILFTCCSHHLLSDLEQITLSL